MSDSDILVDLQDGVLEIVLNRPECMNAIRGVTGDGLLAALHRAEHDAEVRAVLIRGEGRAFSSGADMTVPADQGVGVRRMNDIVRSMLSLPRPIVAAVRGPAAGVGCAVALASDLMLMSEESYLLLAFTRVGLMPDGGASALVAAAAGRQRAMQMALLAEKMPAAEAHAAGLAAEVVADLDLDTRARELAARLAEGPSLAYARTKDAINAAALTEIEPALERELAGQTELIASADFAEGKAAFAEKRRPAFRGE